MNKNAESTFHLMLPQSLIWARFFAIALIYLGHSQLQIGGGYGATFFFTLTGFSMTRIFMKSRYDSSPIMWTRFIQKRFKKTMPTIIVLLVLTLAASFLLHQKIILFQIISVLTFSTNYYNALTGHPNNGLAHLWAISVHMQFCFIYPIIFTRCRTMKALNITLLTLIILSGVYRCLMIYNQWGSEAYIYNSFETRMDALFFGALCALNVEKLMKSNVIHFLIQPLMLLLILSAIYYIGAIDHSWRNSLGFFLQPILFCILILQFVKHETRFGKVRYFNRLGQICFWFYFFHQWGLTIGKHLPLPLFLQVFSGAFILVCLLIMYQQIKELISRKAVFHRLFNKTSEDISSTEIADLHRY